MLAGSQLVRACAQQVLAREQQGLVRGLRQQRVLVERRALARVSQVQRRACPMGLARLRVEQLGLLPRRGSVRNRKAALGCAILVAPIPSHHQYQRAQIRIRGCRHTGLR